MVIVVRRWASKQYLQVGHSKRPEPAKRVRDRGRVLKSDGTQEPSKEPRRTTTLWAGYAIVAKPRKKTGIT